MNENEKNMQSAVNNAISGISRAGNTPGGEKPQPNSNNRKPGGRRGNNQPGGGQPKNGGQNSGGKPPSNRTSNAPRPPRDRSRGKKGGRPSVGGLIQSVSKGPNKDASSLAATSMTKLDNRESGMLYPGSQFQEKPQSHGGAEPKLRIIPLGGLEEVGMNCMAIEYGDDIIIIDLGWMFPDETMPGIDYVLPDITYLEKKKKNIRGVIITHAHLDHIGGAPYLLPKLGFPPVYATQLAAGFMEGPLEEHGHLKSTRFNIVRYQDILHIGAFKLEFAHVNHSIPEGLAVAVTTPVGTIFHSGDFKFDDTPIADAPAELNKLKEWGERGILLAMCDSTNVERTGRSLSEAAIGKNLRAHIAGARGRIILATFSSSIPRIQEALYAAVENSRKVTIVGRSMLKNMEICQRLGYLDIPKDILVDPRDMKRYHDNEILVIATGSQANEMSALVRMSTGDHKQVEIKQGDTVILSSSPIPGNESAVQNMMDDLFRRGADVIYSKLFDIHASGHAYQEELAEMLEMLKPKHFLPIHGPYRNRVLHGRIATSTGVSPTNIHLLDNGKVLEATTSGIVGMTKELVGGGIVFVDGLGVGDVGSVVLRDRKHMAADGMFVIIISVDRKTGRVIGSPDIISRGFIYVREAKDLLKDTRAEVRKVFQAQAKNVGKGKGPIDWSNVKNKIRDDVAQFLYDKTKREPMVLPVILEV